MNLRVYVLQNAFQQKKKTLQWNYHGFFFLTNLPKENMLLPWGIMIYILIHRHVIAPLFLCRAQGNPQSSLPCIIDPPHWGQKVNGFFSNREKRKKKSTSNNDCNYNFSAKILSVEFQSNIDHSGVALEDVLMPCDLIPYVMGNEGVSHLSLMLLKLLFEEEESKVGDPNPHLENYKSGHFYTLGSKPRTQLCKYVGRRTMKLPLFARTGGSWERLAPAAEKEPTSISQTAGSAAGSSQRVPHRCPPSPNWQAQKWVFTALRRSKISPQMGLSTPTGREPSPSPSDRGGG